MFYTILLSIPLLFASCFDDEVIAPNPVISETEKIVEEELPDDNESLETNGFENDVIAEALSMDTNGTDERDEINELADDNTYAINTFFESVYFEFDSFEVSDEMMENIKKGILLMKKERLLEKDIIVEGNCDEWGTDEYNYALGLKRANVIKEVLLIEGISEDRVKIVSYGESNPMCLEETRECRSKNRRVDFKLED
jgi:peptidoglycan-associated lipoprotein